MSLSFRTLTLTSYSFIVSLYNLSKRQCCLKRTLKKDLGTGKTIVLVVIISRRVHLLQFQFYFWKNIKRPPYRNFGLSVWIINLSVFIWYYLHNSWTRTILRVCNKMSVGHICNVVLGGLENICPECVFTCFFGIKQTILTSCPSLFEINVYFSVSFHTLYGFNLMMLTSGVCKSQVTKFC